MESSAAYLIDASYRIIGFNQSASKTYPSLKEGQLCYQCLMGRDKPCDNCPVEKGVQGPRTYVDPLRNILETVDAVEIPLPDGTIGHAMVISTVGEGERLAKTLPSNEEELRWLAVIQVLGDSYGYIFNLNCDTGMVKTYRSDNSLPREIGKLVENVFSYRDVMKTMIQTLVLPEDRSKLMMFVEHEAVRDVLCTRSSFTVHFRMVINNSIGYYFARMARVGSADDFHDAIIALTCEDEDRRVAHEVTYANLVPHPLRRKILVVEDNFINREMLVQMLSPEYEVLCAENGEEGIRILSANYRDLSLVILDVYMPICDGFQFLARTRQDPLLAAVPVIVATGSNRPEDEARCLELGAMDFITKPYNLRGVQGRIRNLIKMRESAATLSEIEFDAQTGLYTRQAFFHHASLLLNTHPETPHQIVVVDIHNFKQVNSIYGENVGDDVIRFLAKELKRLISNGLVCHYDGDSFAFMEPVGHSVEELEKAIRDISKRSPVRKIQFKCGICQCDDLTLPVSVICNRAFLALNSIRVDVNRLAAAYDDPINQQFCREREMETSFEDAVQNQEFVVWYQPKYDVKTERMVGAEALVRWKKQDGTVVSPGEFIPLFERDGLIVRLDEYVFRKVCQMQQFLTMEYGRTLPISVNLSRNSLHYPGMIERYARIIREYQLDAQMVPIELTESSGMNMTQIKELAQKMVSLGFPLHMDDFGSGYSSISNLNSLPFHMLKLDKSLVDYIGNSRGNQVLRHIISLAHGLEMDVLAEGVETAEQVQFLREVGCDVIQGFYFSRPLPERTFLETISAWNQSSDNPGLHVRHALLI